MIWNTFPVDVAGMDSFCSFVVEISFNVAVLLVDNEHGEVFEQWSEK